MNNSLTYPETLEDELSFIIGQPNFACGPLAQVLRDNGRDIPTKAEKEQAVVIDWHLRLYLKHGAKWRDAFAEELRPMLEVSRVAAAKRAEERAKRYAALPALSDEVAP